MKKLILAVMLSVLLLGFGTAMAATSAMDNTPGGSSVGYFQAGNGWVTLLNIQNVADNATLGCSAAMLIHVVLYDPDSNEIVNFNVPCSQVDNWGARIELIGPDVVVTPENCPATLPNGPGADPGCTVQSGTATLGPDGVAVGYITAVITALDCNAPPLTLTDYVAGNNDGNPWNDTNMTQSDNVAPNWIFMRTAIINTTSGVGFALNGRQQQNNQNMNNLSEVAGVDFVDTLTVPDSYCAVAIDWNADGILGQNWFGTDDFTGIRMDTWEWYMTTARDSDPGAVDVSDAVIVDTCLSRDWRVVALGSLNGWYWARFNATPGLSDTTLITVAPSTTGPGNIGAWPMTITGQVFDDNELPASVTFTPIEAARCPYLTATNPQTTACSSVGPVNGISHSTFTTGEHNFFAWNPMYGFSYTVAGNFADLYPLVTEEVGVVVANLQGSFGFSQFLPINAAMGVVLDYNSSIVGVSGIAAIGAWH